MDEFAGVFASFGLDVKGDIARYITAGRPIEPDSDALGPALHPVDVSVLSFDPGFDLAGSNRTGAVSGVVTSGPAYAAGLRDGMKLLASENATRFSNAWDPDAPMILHIRDGAGERVISFLARGAPLRVKQFRAR